MEQWDWPTCRKCNWQKSNFAYNLAFANECAIATGTSMNEFQKGNFE